MLQGRESIKKFLFFFTLVVTLGVFGGVGEKTVEAGPNGIYCCKRDDWVYGHNTPNGPHPCWNWYCRACGAHYPGACVSVHDWAAGYGYNASQHWQKCSCGQTRNTANHSGGTATCTAAKKCSTCGASYGSALGHTGGSATCTAGPKCTRCGVNYGSALGHSYSSAWTTNGTNHWHKCTRCTATSSNAAHTGGTATCTAAKKCSTCGVSYGSALGHSASAWKNDGSAAQTTAKQHWKSCTRCGVDISGTRGNHVDSSPKDGRCDTCACVMDIIPPTIGSITGVQYKNTASGGTVAVTLSGISDTGGSGLKQIQYAYKVPGQDWVYTTVNNTASSYTFNVPITVEGDYGVAVRACDSAGNWSVESSSDSWKRTSIIIDRVVPTYSEYEASLTYTNNPNAIIKISVKVNDDRSGVKTVNINAFTGGSYSTYFTTKIATYNSATGKYEATYTLSEIKNTVTGATNQGEGTFYFDGSAQDNAGNSTWIGGKTITYDRTPPVVKISNPSKSAGKTGDSITYTVTTELATTADALKNKLTLIGTAISGTSYTVSGSGMSYTITIKVGSGDGNLGIRIAEGLITDVAGNRSEKVENIGISVTNTPYYTNHKRVCKICNRIEKEPHTTTGAWQSNSASHWKICDVCNKQVQKGGHTLGAITNGKATCSVCGVEVSI